MQLSRKAEKQARNRAAADGRRRARANKSKKHRRQTGQPGTARGLHVAGSVDCACGGCSTRDRRAA